MAILSHTKTAEGSAHSPVASHAGPSRDLAVEAFRSMVLARSFEDRLASLYRGGSIVGGVYLGRGQEAFSAALAVHLVPGKDVYCPLIRDQAGRLAFGETLIDAARTCLGSAEGPMRGRDGNIHRGRPSRGMPAMISHLGAQISLVGGMLLARRQKGLSEFVGATTIGEGGTSTGAFHEALNFAAVHKLPLVIAVANNQFAYSTPTSLQFACANLADRALGYGIDGYSVDATDLLACLDVFGEATAKARAGGGPQLVVGSLLRLSGHGEHDDASYVPESLKSSKLAQDCLEIARKQVLASKAVSQEDLDALDSAVSAEIDSTIAKARGEPGPNPYEEHWEALSTHRLVEGLGEDV